MLCLRVLPIYNRFQVIQSYNFGCDFTIGGEALAGLVEWDFHKKEIA